MKILHAPHNIAGQASIISRAQRALGVKSDVLILKQSYLNYECDINLNADKKSIILLGFLVGINFIKCLFKYDIFHFHFGASLLPYNIDLPILKLFKKKIIMHYWGFDVIQCDIAAKYTFLSEKDIREDSPNKDDNKTRKKIDRIQRLVNVTIVGDYSLLSYSPDSIVIRQALDVTNIPFVGSEEKRDKIIIIHAPTRRKIKGTKYVLSAIDRLKKEGYPIDFIIVENKTNNEALEIYKKADIVVDALLQGPYGILAIECMALGKPVLERIDEKHIKYYHDLPIVNTSPAKLYDNLKTLIENPVLRKELGIKGRKYVEENHDSKKIAMQLIELYKSL